MLRAGAFARWGAESEGIASITIFDGRRFPASQSFPHRCAMGHPGTSFGGRFVGARVREEVAELGLVEPVEKSLGHD